MSYVDLATIHDPSPLGVAPAGWGDQVRDNGEWLARNKPHARVHETVVQAPLNNTWTSLVFALERFDVGGMHSTVTNTSRLTVPAGGAGLYLIGGHAQIAANGGGTARAIRIRLNGTTVLATGPGAPINAGANAVCHVSTMYALAVGDYVELQAYQNSGVTLSMVIEANTSPEFWCMWLAI